MAQPALDQLWQQRLNHWQSSGLPATRFCKQEGFIYHQFVYWRNKLREPAGMPATTPVASGRLVRVTQQEAIPPVDELTVSLPNGIVITGLQAHNVELLGAILRQL